MAIGTGQVLREHRSIIVIIDYGIGNLAVGLKIFKKIAMKKVTMKSKQPKLIISFIKG
jgi:hypothetical protein